MRSEPPREDLGPPFRRRTFRDLPPLEPTLSGAGYSFLANPAGQLPYLYLTRYVQRLSEAWFRKPLAELEVLDWGSGKGHVSYLLRRRGATRLVGCDTPDAEDAATSPLYGAGGLDFELLRDPVRLPFADERFDVALSFGVLEHVLDDRASLGELRRVLRPGGLLFCFNLPNRWSWVHFLDRFRGGEYHDRLYDVPGTRALVEEAGFRVLDAWRRQLLPKNSVRYPFPQAVERLDQALVEHTPLGLLATSVEFVATRT